MGTATQQRRRFYAVCAGGADLAAVLEQTLSVTMGMADTLMVAGVGEAAVSSVSLVDSLNILIIQILAALATGGAVVASQYMGRRDQESAQRSAAQLYSVLAISTVAVGVLCLALSRPILRGVFGSIDDEVMHYAQQYFIISAISYPFIGLYNGGAALFPCPGQQPHQHAGQFGDECHQHRRQRAVDLWLWHGRCGRGAGYADRPRVCGSVDLVAEPEHPQPAAGGRFCRPAPPQGANHEGAGHRCAVGFGERHVPNRQAVRQQPDLDPGHRRHCGQCRGQQRLHGGQRARRYDEPGHDPSGGPLSGCRGQGTGEKVLPAADRYCHRGPGADQFGHVFAAAGDYHLVPPVGRGASMCTVVVHWFSVFCVVFWAPSFTLPNALRSGGDAKFTMLVSIASMWVFRVILSYFFVLQMHMGLTGVWFGMFVDWICRSILFGVRFYSGKWMEHKVI